MTKVPMTENAPNWFVGKAAERPGLGRHVYTTQRFPIFYVQINKCGCTYLRNLLFLLDHDQVHPFSERVHSFDADFTKATMIPDQVLAASHYVFCAVRDPVDRFLSLYFDKLSDPENKRDNWMQKLFIKEAGLVRDDGLTLEEHRQNCLKALDWIDTNLAGNTEAKTNPHWQRQSRILARVSAASPFLLNLDDLSTQLPVILQPIIPDIAEKMDEITERNESRKPFSRAEMMDEALISAVAAVYPEDTRIISEVRADWANKGII
jgi:sulfotransferase famil protein